MPMETGVVGIRPVERPAAPGGTEGVSRRGGESTEAGFRPQTNVAIENAIDDMAGVLAKIASTQEETVEAMPQGLQKVIENTMKQAFSFDETLGSGLGSTVESQRFSMEQLTSVARTLLQMSALAEKGYDVNISDGLQTLLTELKAAVTEEPGGQSLEPVLLLKAAFGLINGKEASGLPLTLQQVLASLQTAGGQGAASAQTEAQAFLRALVQSFMPGGTTTASAVQNGFAGQAQSGVIGQNAFGPAAQAGVPGQNASGPAAQTGVQGQNVLSSAAPAGAQGQNVPGSAAPAQGQGMTGQAAQAGAQGMAQAEQALQPGAQNVPTTSPATPQANASAAPQTTQGQASIAQEMPGTQPGAQGQAAAGQSAPGQAAAPTEAGPAQAPGASGAQAATAAGETLGQGTQAGGQGQPLQGQPAASGASPLQGQVAAEGQPAMVQGPTTEASFMEQGRPLMQGASAGGRPMAGQAPASSPAQDAAQTLTATAREAKETLMSQPLQNTPETMQTLKQLARTLLETRELPPAETQALQSLADGKETALAPKEARQLETLLRVVQQNIPATVQQAAIQQNIPALPRLWAFLQLSDLSTAKRLNAAGLKKAAKDIAKFVFSMRGSMEGEHAVQQGQRSMDFMMPLYLGENEKSYPAYIHVYDETQPDKETGISKKETWLRLCVLTDNLGAVELTCRVYEERHLDLRLVFADHTAAQDFRTFVPELRRSMRGSALKLEDVAVAAPGE